MQHAINILNSIKNATSRTMAHSIYANAKYASTLNGSYNGADLSGGNEEFYEMKAIQCNFSKCALTYSDAEMSGEMCLDEYTLNRILEEE